MTALVLAEYNQKNIKTETLKTITAALNCDQDVHLIVVGYKIQSILEKALKIDSIKKILYIDNLYFLNATAERIAKQILSIIHSYSHLLCAATAFGNNVIPRIAAQLDMACISEITKVITSDTFERHIYAGRIISIVQSLDKKKIITVRAVNFDPVHQNHGSAVIEKLNIADIADVSTSHFLELKLNDHDRPKLANAKIIVSGGRGLGSKEKFSEILVPLAKKLDAALGASRAAVDAGYITNDYQIGQSGRNVAPELYIAVGISGAIQHLSGMKDSKIIIAINKDPEAPIFQVSDYGIIGDLFTIVPMLTNKL